MYGNREYKSDVFSMLMEIKENALEVYNLVNDSDYDDPNLIRITLLEKGVSLSVRNDASFVLGTDLNLYEHQSTVCPNMPLRFLLYVANTLRKLLANRELFGRKLVKIPCPKFVVFYNGNEDAPAQYEMKLSDAYENQEREPELELKCKVYNINPGKNDELLDKCKVLRDYMTFVNYVKHYLAEYGEQDFKTAVEAAIDRCIREDVLKDFFLENREEVVKVADLDFTFERRLELGMMESRQEGMERGMVKGQILAYFDAGFSVKEIAEKLGRDEAFVEEMLSESSMTG